MYDNNFNISSYYYINEHSTGIIKNIECNNDIDICIYTVDYTKQSDTFHSSKNAYKIGDKINIYYQSAVRIIDLIMFYLLIIIIIILWIFLIIIIIFSNNFNKYLYICYPSIATIYIYY